MQAASTTSFSLASGPLRWASQPGPSRVQLLPRPELLWVLQPVLQDVTPLIPQMLLLSLSPSLLRTRLEPNG